MAQTQMILEITDQDLSRQTTIKSARLQSRAGFHKADVRLLANELGLKNADKPQSACLSSRFPYGTSIDEQLLAQVEQAETVLESLGFTQFRVRHHGDLARIEVIETELKKAMDHRSQINKALSDLGYRYVTLDMTGFRSGSLNEGLQKEQIQVVNIHNPKKQQLSLLLPENRAY